MKKFLIGAVVVLLLSGCSNNNSQEKTSTSAIFKEEMTAVSKIGDLTGKKLSDELLIEDVKEVFNGIFDLAIFESHAEEYGEVTQGAGSNGEGKKVFCCKLPVNVTFVGTKASVKRFVEYFEEIENVVSFGDFKVKAIDEDKFEVNTIVNFLGKSTGGTLSPTKKEYTIRKNEVEVKEDDEFKLRDFDVSMIIRPSNSDSSAISLGVVEDKDYRIYSDENTKKDVTVTFSNEGGKYYSECSIGEIKSEKAQIKPNGNILFDILSCDIVEMDDEISVDLHIINNSNKKVSVITYNDDGRVNVVEKSGSIEVKKQ